MADIFSESANFFEEFDKPSERSDRLLLNRLDDSNKGTLDQIIDENATEEFENGYESDSEGSSSDSEHLTEMDKRNSLTMQGISETLKFFRKKSEEVSRSVPNPSQAPIEDPTEKMNQPKQHIRFEEESPQFNEMKSQLHGLANTIVGLRQKLKILECTKFKSPEGPGVQVVYMNSDFARKYRHEIETFFASLMERDKRDAGGTLPVITDTASSVCVEDNSTDQDQTGQMTQSEQAMALSCCKVYQGFFVDVMGWPLVQGRPELTDGWVSPVYEQAYKLALPEKEPDGPAPPTREKMRSCCFNCAGAHSLRDCKEKKDFGRIAKARQDHAAAMANAGKQSAPPDPRFAHFRPGEISENLRRAMRIGPDVLPPYIYNMRTLGYPPGWLKEAEVHKSGLAMFNEEGQEVTSDGEVLKTGETSNEESAQPTEFDFNKIVQFPGFNEDLPDGVHDAYRDFGASPYHRDMHYTNMIEVMKKVSQQHLQSRKRRSDTYPELGGKRRRVEVGEADMDTDEGGSPKKHKIDNSSSSSVQDETVGRSKQESSQATVEGGVSRQTSPEEAEEGEWIDATTLIELEAKKRELQEELAEEGEVMEESSPPQSTPLEEEQSLPKSPLPGFKSPVAVMNTPSPQSTSLSRVNSTPVVLPAPSPNSEGKGLPEYSKFADGITPHLCLDNIPNATGTYDKMRKLMTKIREKQSEGN